MEPDVVGGTSTLIASRRALAVYIHVPSFRVLAVIIHEVLIHIMPVLGGAAAILAPPPLLLLRPSVRRPGSGGTPLMGAGAGDFVVVKVNIKAYAVAGCSVIAARWRAL